jgi:hypothetical protein
METNFDQKFAEKTEAIVAQFGFKNLKSFIKNQALLMLMARYEKYEAENKRFEAKYHMPFNAFQATIGESGSEEIFTKEDDYLDWRFSKEAMDQIQKQLQELEHA